MVIENKEIEEGKESAPLSQEGNSMHEQADSAENGQLEMVPNTPKETKVVDKSQSASIAQDKNKKEGDLIIVNRLVNFGQEKRNSRLIDTIVIHSSYNALGADPFSVSGIIKEYQEYGVAAHYLIDREGMIYQLVEDKNVAYHAGLSSVPDGRKGVNEFSLGIELVNTKTEQFTDKQYSALNSLLQSLKSKYPIKYVLGHNQIAPGRKDDPWNFQWDRLK